MDVSVSVLNADFRNLRAAVKGLEEAEADSLHMDIMDGHFVDNISYGPDIVKTVRGLTALPLHTHLMISNPGRFVDRFFSAGSDTVTVHLEVLDGPVSDMFDRQDMGLSLNPDTDIDLLEPYYEKTQRILVMSVFPGFGGQEFISGSLARVERIAERREQLKLDFIISVDGGINCDNASALAEAGADEISVGSFVTGSDDPAGTIKRLKNCRNRE